jgi:hypothetical protein
LETHVLPWGKFSRLAKDPTVTGVPVVGHLKNHCCTSDLNIQAVHWYAPNVPQDLGGG